MDLLIAKLRNMVDARAALFSPDGETGPNDAVIDAMSKDIRYYIYEHHTDLPIDVIIESLTHLGDAPSVLYDDNGHFTIGRDGTQNLPTWEEGWETRETTFQGTWWIEPGKWKPTIREALNDYIDDMQSDEDED